MTRQHQHAEVRDAIVTMYLDGLTVRQIAQVSQLSVPSLVHLLMAHGLRHADRGKNLVEFWTDQYEKIIDGQ
jgi:hypothetical protein